MCPLKPGEIRGNGNGQVPGFRFAASMLACLLTNASMQDLTPLCVFTLCVFTLCVFTLCVFTLCVYEIV
jgi:hypothetical protein